MSLCRVQRGCPSFLYRQSPYITLPICHCRRTRVSRPITQPQLSPLNRYLRSLFVPATLPYILSSTLTVTAVAFLGCIRDSWAFGLLMTLVNSRMINLVVARRRSIQDLSGEPSGECVLLIRLSQDRWRSAEADLRTVVARQGLRPRSGMDLPFVSGRFRSTSPSPFPPTYHRRGTWLSFAWSYALPYLWPCATP